MKSTRVGFSILLAAALALAAMAAQSQTRYTCRTKSGTTYQSSQPCPSNIVIYGPVPERPRYEAPIPKIGEAPSNLGYLSPRCASLNDALRTANARGLSSETVGEMRKNYRRECAESESEAYARMAEERGEKVQQRRAAVSAEKVERERSAVRDQQCGESKRILVTKRARTDLNEGEKAELRRFEDNYRARCGG